MPKVDSGHTIQKLHDQSRGLEAHAIAHAPVPVPAPAPAPPAHRPFLLRTPLQHRGSSPAPPPSNSTGKNRSQVPMCAPLGQTSDSHRIVLESRNRPSSTRPVPRRDRPRTRFSISEVLVLVLVFTSDSDFDCSLRSASLSRDWRAEQHQGIRCHGSSCVKVSSLPDK